MKIKLVIALFTTLLVISTVFTSVSAQNFEEYKKELFVSSNDTLPYRILFPKDFDRSKSYPLILFLHGSGERGNDNELQLKHGADFFLKDSIRENYPAVIVFPQCKTDMSWNNVKYDLSDPETEFEFPKKHEENLHLSLTEGLINQLIEKFNLDTNRLYVGGLSMGGMGTFELVNRNPRRFAAAIAICGGAHPNIARRIRRTSWWIFHGQDDDVVPLASSMQIFEALEKKNADVKITIYPNVKHESWINTFAEPGLMSWLFSKNR